MFLNGNDSIREKRIIETCRSCGKNNINTVTEYLYLICVEKASFSFKGVHNFIINITN